MKSTFNFADPLGLDVFLHYPNIAKRISAVPIQVRQTKKDATKTPLQNQNSNLCGLYCIYIAHFLLGSYYPLICYISETDLLRFVKLSCNLMFNFKHFYSQTFSFREKFSTCTKLSDP